MSKLNLIAIVAIVAAFALSAVIVTEVFAAQINSANTSIAKGNITTMGGFGTNGTSGPNKGSVAPALGPNATGAPAQGSIAPGSGPNATTGSTMGGSPSSMTSSPSSSTTGSATQ